MSETETYNYGSFSLGDLLERERTARKLSRAKLAEMAGVNPNSLAKWEKAGKRDGKYPPLPKLTRLCRILEIDPRDVFTLVYEREEERKPEKQTTDDEFCSEGFIPYDGDDAFSFRSYFASKKREYDLQHIIGQLQALDYYNDELYARMDRFEEALSKIASMTKENGPNRDDPSRPSQNTPKAVPAAPNHPKQEDDQK